MKNKDKKFIEFRSELINLLDKYNCEISGTALDDGSMQITDLCNGEINILTDSFNNYNMKDADYNDISTDYILNMFDDKISIKPNKARVGIFTNSNEKALKLLDDIYNDTKKQNIKHYKKSKDNAQIMMNDGTHYIVIPPRRSSIGYRCSKAYIDKTVTINQLNDIILPICIYCEKKDVIIF